MTDLLLTRLRRRAPSLLPFLKARARKLYLPLAARLNGTHFRLLGEQAPEILHTFLLRRANALYRAREDRWRRALRSSSTLKEYLASARSRLTELVGPLPERSPLRPQVTGVLVRGGYRIEKILFQSRPDHHITATLYLPAESIGPTPGVLVTVGHQPAGKAAPTSQLIGRLLVRHGFTVLVADSSGQGERYQLGGRTGRLRARGGTTEHTLLDAGACLVGSKVLSYQLWDNIRALDFLSQRKEVDPQRLGVVGHSGGGAQAIYLTVMDPRIGACASSCFITSQEGLLNSIGPQDGCQNLVGEGFAAIEHVDLLALCAPRPVRILAAEKDFFDFGGTVESYQEARKAYELLGLTDQLDLFSFPDRHAFSRPRREAAVAWMLRAFRGSTEQAVSEGRERLDEDDVLQVTQSGQVVREFPSERTVADLNLSAAERLRPRREACWKESSLADRQDRVRALLGLAQPEVKLSWDRCGTIRRWGYSIEKLILRRDGAPPLPALLLRPDRDLLTDPPLLSVDSRGMKAEAGRGGALERFARSGRAVLSLDLRGFGETADNSSAPSNNRKYLNREHRVARLSFHIGRPLVGQRVEDTLTGIDFLRHQKLLDDSGLEIVAWRGAVPVALHAAFLTEEILRVQLYGGVRSWMDLVRAPATSNALTHLVPGALRHYDLPDLFRDQDQGM